ncbi:MAG: ATP-binding cassette domain-containing protein, partial [Clostridiales bacterium]|nr:ATP-binding cassette domain-containing protein [Clostridiales bacterium]
MAVLEMKNIKKNFGEAEVLKDISLTVNEGDVVSIIGPSGSGKSTLLRCATLLEKITSGSLSYIGNTVAHTENGKAIYSKDLSSVRRVFGLVFQNFNLFPHYSVMKNITDAPISVLHRKKEEVYAQCAGLLKKMGLEDKADLYPYQLS